MVLAQDPAREFDLHDPRTVEHLDDVFAEMHAHCPIAFSERHGGHWVITGYELLTDAAKDWQTFTSTEGLVIPEPPPGLDMSRKVPPLSNDPPLHRQYRQFLNPFFTPTVVATYEPGIREVVNGLIDNFADAAAFDLLSDFAVPLPAMVLLGHVVGMPAESMAKFREVLVGAPDATSRRDPIGSEVFQTLLFSEVRRYLQMRAEQPPRGDVIDSVRAGTIDGEPLSFDDQVGMVVNLFVAGSVTTTDAIAYSGFYLAGHPEARQQLIDDPSLMDRAVEEFLRLSAPVTADARRVTADTELCGQQLQKGQQVYLVYGAANLDPSEFPDPHEWDIDRPNVQRHVTFGSGHHHCLGSHLARLELKVSLQEILRRLPDFRLADGAVPTRKLGAGNRLEQVPIVLEENAGPLA